MYLVYVKRNQPYADSMAVGRHRVRFTIEQKMTPFDVTKDQILEYNNVYEVETEEHANALGELLATKNPTKEVVIAEIKALWQSETPAVKKKSVSEKGVLPA